MTTREPLWTVKDQAARLAELVSHDGDLKEAPLRRDVRSLGRLLGEVLKEQVGDELFAAVEELRSLLIQHREVSARAAVSREATNAGELIRRAQQIVSRPAFSGKEQHGIAMLLPVLAQQLQRSFREGHIAVFGALTVAHVNHHAGAVDVGDAQIASLLQTQAAGVDGGETDAVAAVVSPERESGALPRR